MLRDTFKGFEKPRECPMAKKKSADSVVRDIRRRTRRKFSAEEKIRIVLEGIRGEDPLRGLLIVGIYFGVC